MAMAFLTVLILVTLAVAGFLVYGMFLGVVRLSKLVVQGYRWLIVQ